MVGGEVIGVSRNQQATLLNVRDKNGQECAVKCVEKRRTDGSPVQISVGDAVWWQCGWVMWTPKWAGQTKGEESDIQLPKVGYSH